MNSKNNQINNQKNTPISPGNIEFVEWFYNHQADMGMDDAGIFYVFYIYLKSGNRVKSSIQRKA